MKASDSEIISFALKQSGNIGFNPSDIDIHIKSDTIRIHIKTNTDLSSLIPDITIKGISISPATGIPQDFSRPVTYTVTAENGNKRKYVVIVTTQQAGSIVYFGCSNNTFYALDANTGALKWKYEADNWFSFSSPAVNNGIVYAGCINGNLYAFDALTGAVQWKFAAEQGIESSPAVFGGTVYFGSTDDHLYAVDALTGQLKWKYSAGYNVGSSPTVANGIVYFGSDDSYINALDATTGAVKWRYQTPSLLNQSSPSVVEGILYIGCRDGYLYALDAASGILKWKYDAKGISLEMTSPTVVDGRIYMTGWYKVSQFSEKGSAFVLDAKTGSLIWESLHNLGFASSPFVAGDKVFVGCDDGNFYALNKATGNVVWEKYIIPNNSSPTIADGTAFIGGGGTGLFYALDVETGNIKWSFPIRNGLCTSNPSVLGEQGIVYHPSNSGAQP